MIRKVLPISGRIIPTGARHAEVDADNHFRLPRVVRHDADERCWGMVGENRHEAANAMLKNDRH